MMNNQFSQKITDIIIYSKEEAHRLMNASITPAHLLLGIIRDDSNKAKDILLAHDIDLNVVKQSIDNLLRKDALSTSVNMDDILLSDDASRILKLAILESRLLKSDSSYPEHLLLAILRDDKSNVVTLLKPYDISYSSASHFLQFKTKDTISLSPSATLNEDDDDDYEDDFPSWKDKEAAAEHSSAKQNTATLTPVLDNFGTDLTQSAEDGLLDAVIGRENEINRLAQILCRRKKNNPILIGDPGVGKSAIVEGLALRIAEHKVSRMLFDKRIVALDLSAVVAGTKYRGQFEERIRSILKELKKNPNIIIFIDEIHTIVGAGSAAGSMDAANMLKPVLARGEIQCIGATSVKEYRSSIEKDAALERRFQKVLVNPTTLEETFKILNNIKDRYEEHHNVTYTEEAINSCVQLADRYISDRNFPDKAIDILDEAGARVHLVTVSAPKELEEQEALIASIKLKKIEAVKQQNFELAASYRDKEKTHVALLEELTKKWKKQQRENKQIVNRDQVENVVSSITGIPVSRMAIVENKKLIKMNEQLKAAVISQDTAVDKLVKAIRRGRTGLKDPNRPIGSFLFLGPTGVGKTLLAKELAKNMFGSADAIIRIDMSEYMEKFAASRLIGAPPGYVGYEEGGQLSEKVKRKPYSIVLFDEIEKAHSDVFNILLQIMDEGRLTDSSGCTIDFRNTVIIMTSNIGSRQIKERKSSLGFELNTPESNEAATKSIIKKSLEKTFSPEFLNRIDEIITFSSLQLNDIQEIITIELNLLSSRIAKLGYTLQISDAAKRYIAEKGYDSKYGARPLKRAIQSYLEDAIAEKLIQSDLQSGATISVDLTEDTKKICVETSATSTE